ncbi:aldo/keto reductase [Marinobacter sp.]|uniref:aldo/keto reductase n=1 Tax=Marinobacter sp. TaxID=50741 RepID=UPI00356ADFB0
METAIDRALAALAIEQIDTFLIHRPDPLMQAEDVARVLENAASAGRVRQIGVSKCRNRDRHQPLTKRYTTFHLSTIVAFTVTRDTVSAS